MRSWGTRLVTIVVLITIAGCATPRRLDLDRRTGGNAALYGQFRAYDGATGRHMTFAEVVERCREADVVFFGEQHYDVVCNQLQAQLLAELLQAPRPMALSMEFFESDTQSTLDAYLRGRIDEPSFLELARQGRRYAVSHRALVELCRATRTPVLAANAPRRLVTAYRKSGLGYEAYRAGLPASDQRWLPPLNLYLVGGYEDRFFAIMGGHGPAMPAPEPAEEPAAPGEEEAPTTAPAEEPTAEMPPHPPVTQPAATQSTAKTDEVLNEADAEEAEEAPDPSLSVERLYLAQLLWDEAMAMAVREFRERFPKRCVLHVVGVFHVAREGGTVRKYAQVRPDDRIVSIAYEGTPDTRLVFDERDRGAADIVIYGVAPPPEPMPAMPVMPAGEDEEAGPDDEVESPTTHPATQPAPASAPVDPPHSATSRPAAPHAVPPGHP